MNTFECNWRFSRKEEKHFEAETFPGNGWTTVDLPHDWAVEGPFSKDNDPDIVIVDPTRDLSTTYCHPGRTGGLPHVGKGFYRKEFQLELEKNQSVRVEFDGIMSLSKVYCNGSFVGGRPYGYSSFALDLTEFVRDGKNLLAVSAENLPGASRWYPGGGIYRHARLVVTDKIHIAYQGIRIHTEGDNVFIRNRLENPEGTTVPVTSILISPDGKELGRRTSSGTDLFYHELKCSNALRWQPGAPNLYKIISCVGRERIETYFGFRDLEFDPDKGFFINGRNMKFQGVCLHHDLGIVGAAVHRDITKHRLNLLKSIGCNAIRTVHNPPDPELLDLCDELGFLVICEAFDEWKRPKTPNGYNLYFDEWGERDLRDMIRRDANHPCVILWSIGNEIDEQYYPEGPDVTRRLCDICHNEDPTRPTTAGLNNPDDAMTGGLFDIVDVKGFNYKPYIYSKYHEAFPEAAMYSSESASTISSRGEYSDHIFEELGKKENLQIDSFDLCNSSGATTPDHEFKGQDDNPFVMGEFVWTGFDYLGEPTPYREEWPARSSYYGIYDLCGIPKDRAFLYRSRWTDQNVLHLMPHWNWEGYEGRMIPVQCYSSFRRVELFVNGKSMGIHAKNPKKLFGTYRHVWSHVPYQPGELRVNALDDDGNILANTSIFTAGEPDHLTLDAVRCGTMIFVTVSVVDVNGTLCPDASERIDFESDGKIIAADAGDPTSTKPFPLPYAYAFHGKCAVWIQGRDHTTIRANATFKKNRSTQKIIIQ